MENDAVPKEVFVEADSDSLTINDYWDTSVDENRSSNEQPTETYGSLQVCPVSLVELDANSNLSSCGLNFTPKSYIVLSGMIECGHDSL